MVLHKSNVMLRKAEVIESELVKHTVHETDESMLLTNEILTLAAMCGYEELWIVVSIDSLNLVLTILPCRGFAWQYKVNYDLSGNQTVEDERRWTGRARRLVRS